MCERAEAAGAPREIIAQAEIVLADLDGCLAAGNVPLPGAADFAEALGERLFLVSNNSTESAESLAALLAEQGLAIAPDRILLAGELAVSMIAEAHPRAHLLLAGNELRARQAEALGLRLGEEPAGVVLLTRDTGFDYAKLQAIVVALQGGARLYAANPDLTHPGPGGIAVPETGALLAAVRACVPEVPASVIGKPEPAIFRAALARAGVKDPSRAVMIGDNPTTDIAGARALGMSALLIGPAKGAAAADIASLLPL